MNRIHKEEPARHDTSFGIETESHQSKVMLDDFLKLEDFLFHLFLQRDWPATSQVHGGGPKQLTDVHKTQRMDTAQL